MARFGGYGRGGGGGGMGIEIKPEVVDPDDVEMLEDLITAAANEAYAEADELVKNSPLSQLGGL